MISFLLNLLFTLMNLWYIYIYIYMDGPRFFSLWNKSVLWYAQKKNTDAPRQEQQLNFVFITAAINLKQETNCIELLILSWSLEGQYVLF